MRTLLLIAVVALPACGTPCIELEDVCSCVSGATEGLVDAGFELQTAYGNSCDRYWEGSLNPAVEARCSGDVRDLREAAEGEGISCQ